MDIATIVGVVFCFLLVFGSIAAGGGVMIFFNAPSLMITLGGMICATLIHFSLPQFLGIFSIIKKTIVTKIPLPGELILKMVNYAAINRRDGSLALEEEMKKASNPFLVKGLQMVIDGQDAANIRDIMNLEIQYVNERHGNGRKMLEFMGSAAPAFGMIGTLIGLVQMLRNMSSPDQIGAGMAMALITTFYGAIAANIIFVPLAGKLGIYSRVETTSMEMIVEGVCAIAQGAGPSAVREKLQAFVAQGTRE